jgi:tetratricopeptide (TPR) repeat protein
MSLAAPDDLTRLRADLAAAEKAEEKAAIVEIARRLLSLTPNDDAIWDRIASNQYALEDFDRMEQTLDAWAKERRKLPPAIQDFRGDLASQRKHYDEAEGHWLAFLRSNPSGADAAIIYDKLADVSAEQTRSVDEEKYCAKAIAAHDSAARRVAHANALLRLHRWDAAESEIARANQIDSADSAVEEWLPQHERLRQFLPQIKAADQQLAQSPTDLTTLLDQARLFTIAGHPALALDNSERALKLEPAATRARIQAGEALLDLKRADDAAKLHVSAQLARAKDTHVTEEALRALSDSDARIIQNPETASALTARASTLRELKQYVLALVDAQAALKAEEGSAAAHAEAARSLNELDRSKEALAEIRRASELAPNNPAIWSTRGTIEAGRADFTAAIESLSRSLRLDESLAVLQEREKYERRAGQIASADGDAQRIRELESK